MMKDEAIGTKDLMRLAIFLIGDGGGKAKGKLSVVPTTDDVGCVWRGMIADRNDDGLGVGHPSSGAERRRQLDGYIIHHPSSVGALTATDRPFTIEQLEMMAGVLLRVAEGLSPQSQYLNQVLFCYRAEIVGVMKRQNKESAIRKKDDSIVLEEDRESSFHVFRISSYIL